MNFEEIAKRSILESVKTKEELLRLELQNIIRAGELAANVLQEKGKILFCGNGGSSCDASHIAAELVVRYKSGNERPGLPAIALSSDHAVITACGNDYGYNEIFARQVEAFGRSGDLLVAITTSGNSENVIRAVDKAKATGLKILSLLGGNGGKLKGKSDVEIIVPSFETARIQESHILIGHIICSIIEKKLFGLD
ncbi:MAG: SIS domain-containing protein [Leptospira sp.]|nr:SIS domain-containing protein [Leptospira sp.]